MSGQKQTTKTSGEAHAKNRSQTGAPPTRSTPPYHPALQKLVAGKQAWSEPLDTAARGKGFLGWHQRGYLPHYDAPGVTQFVTLRLMDSLPASRRGEWEHLLKIESQLAGTPACSQLIGEQSAENRPQAGAPIQRSAESRERRKRLEEYLDRGFGECWLRQPAIAKLTEGALRFFDGERYALAAWVVMPNHVHLLVDIWDTPLAALVKSWKGFVARVANKTLGRSGAFWERDYSDTLIADADHRRTAVRYIENNPTKARLVLNPKAWLWSSARWRDDYGRLKYSSAQSRPQADAPGAPACSRLKP
jgi:REP element-mobilizing transposase RayT